MIKFVCNRCGKDIVGNTYYTVDIYGHDINPTNDNRVACTTATQNISMNMIKIFEKEKHYCKECKEKIEEYINTNI